MIRKQQCCWEKVINTSCEMRVFSTNFARSQDKRAVYLFPITYKRIEYIEGMSTIVAILLYVGVFALVEIFSKDDKTPDKEWEEFLKRRQLRDAIGFTKKRRKDYRKILNSLKEIREEARRRMQDGSLTEKEVFELRTNIPHRFYDEKRPDRFRREIYELGEEFIEELNEYCKKQGYTGRRENRFKKDNNKMS